MLTSKPKEMAKVDTIATKVENEKVKVSNEIQFNARTTEKKILIEEIKDFNIILDEQKRNGSVEVNEKGNVVEISVGLPQESGMKNIILDANSKMIKLDSSAYSFQVVFTNYNLTDSQISAKWLSKTKKLKIGCPFSK